MKTKTTLIKLITLIAVSAFVFQSCTKDEGNTNQSPTCKITSPTNGQEITKGETVTIAVDANDSDGSINEVRFFIDNVGTGSATSFPYNYNWNTDNEDIGNHTLKATSYDNSGGNNSDEITIEIIEGGGTGTFADPRDEQTYKTIDIGNQTWFAENLNFTTSNSWTYDDDPANSDIYGRLYTWDAALTACPNGWHLPSDDEWKTLEMELGMSQIQADKIELRGTDEGGKMKEIEYTHWEFPNTGATNSSGLTALPGGYRNPDGAFLLLGMRSTWWTATETSSGYAAYHYIEFISAKAGRYGNVQDVGFGVRCLKD